MFNEKVDMANKSVQSTIGGMHEQKEQFDAEYEIDDPLGPAEAGTTTTTTAATSMVLSCFPGC